MLKSYGFDRKTPTEDPQVEEFKLKGFTVLKNILSPQEIDYAKNSLDRIYQQQETEFHKDRLAEINELHSARALLVYDHFFLEKIALQSKVFSFVQSLLAGPAQLHLQNGIINKPSTTHHQSSWHRDLPYQNWVCNKPLAINAFYCLCDFTSENGGTWFLPGSHLMEEVPSDDFILKNSVQPSVQSGSVIVFNSMILHCAGNNLAKTDRPAINNLYTVPIIKQQINLPEAMGGRIESLGQRERVLLGFEYDVPKSVNDWRQRRLAKNKKPS